MAMTMTEVSEYLRSKNSLSDGWEVYAFEHLPAGSYSATHVQFTGAIPRLLLSGKNKDQKTWRDEVEKRVFIVSFDELNSAEES